MYRGQRRMLRLSLNWDFLMSDNARGKEFLFSTSLEAHKSVVLRVHCVW